MELPDEILKRMLTMFEAHGQTAFKAIWDAARATAQVKILETLLLISENLYEYSTMNVCS